MIFYSCRGGPEHGPIRPAGKIRRNYHVTGLVLAGGGSRRMGADKATLELGGQPVIGHVVGALSQVCHKVIIVSDEPGRYRHLGLGATEIHDGVPGRGPLAGLHAGLAASPTPVVIMAGCDMPFISPLVLRAMMKAITPSENFGIPEKGSLQEDPDGFGDQFTRAPTIDAVVPVVKGRLQPMHALYHRRLIQPVEELLEGTSAGGPSPGLMHLLRREDIGVYPFEPGAGSPVTMAQLERSVFNMNTPEDYQQARNIYAGGAGQLPGASSEENSKS